MESNYTFNALGYFEHLAKSNRLAKDNGFCGALAKACVLCVDVS